MAAPNSGSNTFNGTIWVPTAGSGLVGQPPGTAPTVPYALTPGGQYVPTPLVGIAQISQQILGAAAPSLVFSGIAQNFSILQLVINSATAKNDSFDDIGMTFNGDTATHYAFEVIGGFASTAFAAPSTGASAYGDIGGTAGATATGLSGTSIVTIPSYSKTVLKKSYISNNTRPDGTDGTANYSMQFAGLWTSTAAITSITLTPVSGANFVVGTVATLYGLQ